MQTLRMAAEVRLTACAAATNGKPSSFSVRDILDLPDVKSRAATPVAAAAVATSAAAAASPSAVGVQGRNHKKKEKQMKKLRENTTSMARSSPSHSPKKKNVRPTVATRMER